MTGHTTRHSHPLTRDLAVLAALTALAAPVLVGHTRTTAPVWLMAGSDLLHLIVASVWLGGLVGLTVTLSRSGARTLLADDAARILTRFSRLALLSVGVLVLSGITMAWLVLDTLDLLWLSTYGLLLLAKLASVGVAVGLAAWNRFRLLPAVTAASSLPEGGEPAGWRVLRRTVGVEALVLVAVVAVTGALTATSPHGVERDMPGEGPPAVATLPSGTLHAQADGLAVDGALEPAEPGVNTVRIHLVHEGRPVTTPHVRITATREPPAQTTPGDTEAGEASPGETVTARVQAGQGPGDYTGQLELPSPGTWRVSIAVDLEDGRRAHVDVPVTL